MCEHDSTCSIRHKLDPTLCMIDGCHQVGLLGPFVEEFPVYARDFVNLCEDHVEALKRDIAKLGLEADDFTGLDFDEGTGLIERAAAMRRELETFDAEIMEDGA